MICTLSLLKWPTEIRRALLGIYVPAVSLDLPCKHYYSHVQSLKVILDAYAFSLLFLNALARPRTASKKLFAILYGDGALFFIVRISVYRHLQRLPRLQPADYVWYSLIIPMQCLFTHMNFSRKINNDSGTTHCTGMSHFS